MGMRVSAGVRELADNRAEKVGLARFFRNKRVTGDEILQTAAERTGAAAAGRHVLLIEDTSEVTYEAKAKRKRGLGRVGNGAGVGLFVHPALAVDAADGAVLGLPGATIWRGGRVKEEGCQSLPIEKESWRWIATALEATTFSRRPRSPPSSPTGKATSMSCSPAGPTAIPTRWRLRRATGRWPTSAAAGGSPGSRLSRKPGA
jgi:hypothetical protein